MSSLWAMKFLDVLEDIEIFILDMFLEYFRYRYTPYTLLNIFEIPLERWFHIRFFLTSIRVLMYGHIAFSQLFIYNTLYLHQRQRNTIKNLGIKFY